MLMHSHDMYKDTEKILQPYKRMQSMQGISLSHDYAGQNHTDCKLIHCPDLA